MSGRIIAVLIIASGLIAGAAMYYLQVYGYYYEVKLAGEGGEVALFVTRDGGAEPLETQDFRGIDADSSPQRFRACFRVDPAAFEGADRRENPVPLNAPRWFDCFDAARIGADLISGAATAYLGEANVTYGFDRVIAIYPDGRAHAWHQINVCGEEVFDGRPPPEGCPPAP